MALQLPWDAEVDTPATVAVIGGGAVGIEAALYARFLGYYVLLIEGTKMAQSWRRGGHLPMLTAFGEATSSLGVAALEAHRPEVALPDPNDHLTGLQFAEKYLVPLAKTDLLSECVHVHSRVVSVSRLEVRRESPGDIQDRADIEFRLAIHSKNRGWFTERADVVLDCSGVTVPQFLGPGGGIAMGEVELADELAFQLPDVLGKDRPRYESKRVLLVGTSQAAYQSLLSIAELISTHPQTRLTWIVTLDPGMKQPIELLDNLRTTSAEGARLAEQEKIRAALSGTLDGVVVLTALGIERITNSAAGLNICLQSDEDNTLDIVCDCIISNTGLQPDWDHATSLRIARTAALDQPQLEFRSAEKDSSNGDVVRTENIVTMEPHYYVLGSKSYGAHYDRFHLAHGHQQIRQAFAFIGGRPQLDLYKSLSSLGT